MWRWLNYCARCSWFRREDSTEK